MSTAKYRNLVEPPRPFFYVPVRQTSLVAAGLQIRTAQTPAAIAPIVIRRDRDDRRRRSGVAAHPVDGLSAYGVSPRDPLAFGVAFVVIAIASLTACFLPAWRATRTDPLLALRG